MSYIFKMPDVGEGIAEGEIVTWFVKVGDVVTEDQPLMEIQNDKLVQEVPSPVAGTVTKILVEAGTVSTVGDDLIEISTGGSAPVAAAPALDGASSDFPLYNRCQAMRMLLLEGSGTPIWRVQGMTQAIDLCRPALFRLPCGHHPGIMFSYTLCSYPNPSPTSTMEVCL